MLSRMRMLRSQLRRICRQLSEVSELDRDARTRTLKRPCSATQPLLKHCMRCDR
jgi:hypothetical protein